MWAALSFSAGFRFLNNLHHFKPLLIFVASPSVVGAAISFALLRISSIVEFIALSHCSSIKHISFASSVFGFANPLMMTGSPLLQQQ